MKTVQRERLYTAASIAAAAIILVVTIYLLMRNRRKTSGCAQGGASPSLPTEAYPLRR